VNPESVVVVGNGIEQEYFDAAAHPQGISGEPVDQPFILCVGGLNFLDGGDRVIAATSVLSQRVPGVRVLMAGCQHAPFAKARFECLPNAKLLGYVEAPRLARYMRDATALLFPTRYETFGIAAAEAMAAGTPVITCRCTAVPEVVGQAGIYVNPERPEEVAEVVEELLQKPSLRARYSALGSSRSRLFTWQACVGRLCEALKTN
jgi:glycosyltransferase involved in cell wall biosynthesis